MMRGSAAAAVFAALGDETRLSLVMRMSAHGPQSIAQLTEHTEVTRQAVTKHLVALEDAGLVKSSREGRERIWEIHPRRISEARAYLDQIGARWDAAIDRLRAFMETDD